MDRPHTLATSRTFNVAAFCGGGIRAYFSALVWARLVRECPQLAHCTAATAGTSAGSFIALAIAAGRGPSSIVRLFEAHSSRIFRRQLSYYVGWGAKYDNAGLREVLLETFGDLKLGELEKFVLVPSYDLDAPATANRPRMAKAKIWNNSPRAGADDDEFVVDVALRSSAAPTYFPVYDGHVDGGIVANNPSAAALAEARAHGVPDDKIRILSIGTGLVANFIDQGKREPTSRPGEKVSTNRGVPWWAPKLPTHFVDGVSGVATFQNERDLGPDRHHRVNAIIDRPIALDDVGALDELHALAMSVDLAPTISWLRTCGWMD